MHRIPVVFVLLVLVATTGCTPHNSADSTAKTGEMLKRTGDEIVVCGQMFHTGTRVITWMDSGGYDAYRVERRFAAIDQSDWDNTKQSVKGFTTPNRYSQRKVSLTDEQQQQVRGGGWPLSLLQAKVDQFVLHYDVCGTSRQCFNILHDHRDLSVHFLLDADGTIYQTLDLKERAWHATIANDRSIGIEIANIGAYPVNDKTDPLGNWYRKTPDGKIRLMIPASLGGNKWLHTPDFVGYPDRQELIVGEIQGTKLKQYDLTPEQYASLAKLTATLCTVFPKIKLDYPKDENGKLIPHVLSEQQFAKYTGVLGHYHISKGKTDPGPAMQWDRLMGKARKLMNAK